jgi:hypothetical protein
MCVHKLVKRGTLIFIKHVHNLYIVRVVGVVQIYHSLSTVYKHGSIYDDNPEIAMKRSPVDQKDLG